MESIDKVGVKGSRREQGRMLKDSGSRSVLGRLAESLARLTGFPSRIAQMRVCGVKSNWIID